MDFTIRLKEKEDPRILIDREEGEGRAEKLISLVASHVALHVLGMHNAAQVTMYCTKEAKSINELFFISTSLAIALEKAHARHS